MMKAERMDLIGFGDLRLIQQPEDFCYGVDAVILSDFAAKGMKNAKSIMDLGTGNGIIPLILSHKKENTKIYGLEIQEGAFQIANRNVHINNLNPRVEMIQGNVRDIGAALCPELKENLDAMVSNPPYMENRGGIKNDNPAKTIARHETAGELGDFFEAAGRLLKHKGHFFLVHRPYRMVDLFCMARAVGLEPKEMRLVSPRMGEPPNIVLVHYIKGGGKELKIEPPLYIYTATGEYTDEILAIYEK